MSGGFFEYQDYRLDDMADQLVSEAEEKRHTAKAKDLFRETAKQLQNLRSKLHHIDYFLEGDIGEECMFKRIEEDEK